MADIKTKLNELLRYIKTRIQICITKRFGFDKIVIPLDRVNVMPF